MPSIGRRPLLLAVLPLTLAAGLAQENSVGEAGRALERLVQDASRALQACNPGLFLSYFRADSFPEYPQLAQNVVALCARHDVASSVAVVRIDWAGERAKIEVDWALQLVSSTDSSPIVRRRERVRLEAGQDGKKGRWKFVALKPAEFFAPAA